MPRRKKIKPSVAPPVAGPKTSVCLTDAHTLRTSRLRGASKHDSLWPTKSQRLASLRPTVGLTQANGWTCGGSTARMMWARSMHGSGPRSRLGKVSWWGLVGGVSSDAPIALRSSSYMLNGCFLWLVGASWRVCGLVVSLIFAAIVLANVGCGSSLAAKYPQARIYRVCALPGNVEQDAHAVVITKDNVAISDYLRHILARFEQLPLPSLTRMLLASATSPAMNTCCSLEAIFITRI